MRTPLLTLAACLMLCGTSFGQTTAIAWGNNEVGQCDVPAGETFVQVAAGSVHNIGLQPDGTTIAWGANNYGQCDVPANENFVQITAGGWHGIGLRADGTAIAWGWNASGQCNVPASEIFMQVGGGAWHSIGLRADGTAIAWGDNWAGQCDVPPGETFVQVDAGNDHTIGLRPDGTAVAWGQNNYGQCDVPPGETFVQVAAGHVHTIGLRADGTAIAWGHNNNGQCDVPASETFVQVDVGWFHTVGLRADGTVILWGDNSDGQCNPPAGEYFVKVAAGSSHTVALLSPDTDGDDVPDSIDNCYLYNPGQADCNGNGIGDVCDVADQTSFDCNQNIIPDECESDCDGDGLIDECDNDTDIDGDGIPDNCEEDCNGNSLPDDWEIDNGISEDCNENGSPDECDVLERGTVSNIFITDPGGDYPTDKILEIVDSNPNSSGGAGFSAFCTILTGGLPDVPSSSGQVAAIRVTAAGSGYEPGVPIALITGYGKNDCTALIEPLADGTFEVGMYATNFVDRGSGFTSTPHVFNPAETSDDPAEFQAVLYGGIGLVIIEDSGEQYRSNLQLEVATEEPVYSAVLEAEIEPVAEWFSDDCNANGIPDECDLDDGAFDDENGNGIIDDCECLADISDGTTPGEGDGLVNVNDLLAIIGYWGSAGPIGDINIDGTVDVNDLLLVIGAWGPCP